jgi:ABC-type sugar transport system permease subunit
LFFARLNITNVTCRSTSLAEQAVEHRASPSALARSSWWQRHQRSLMPYVFVLPFFVIYGVFRLYPVLSALNLSLHESVGLGSPTFVGLRNYTDLLADSRFLHAVRNTSVYAAASVFILSPMALAVALAIRSSLVPGRLKGFYRVVFFLPQLTSFVVIALMFGLVFDKDFGLLNAGLRAIGFPQPNWLRSETFALPSIILTGIWTYIGINALYFLAGLQNVPEELREAAAIDGAETRQIFWHVTIPLLRPTILFVGVQATIFSFQLFEIPFLLTGEGPSDSTLTLAIYLYQTGFRSFDRGYAAAIGMLMALISLLLTALWLFLFRRSKTS